MKMKSIFLISLCIISALTGCSTFNSENSSRPNNSSSEISSKPGITTSSFENSYSSSNILNSNLESTSSSSSLPAVEDFLNSTDGANFQIAAKEFTKAYLSGDAKTIKSYLIDPKSNVVSAKNRLDDVKSLKLKLASKDIKNNSIHAQYEILFKDEVGYSYLDLNMEKANDGWKVNSYGLEQ